MYTKRRLRKTKILNSQEFEKMKCWLNDHINGIINLKQTFTCDRFQKLILIFLLKKFDFLQFFVGNIESCSI